MLPPPALLPGPSPERPLPLLLLLLAVLLPRPAAACGGFACDVATTIEPPVQDAERIVFAVRDGPEGRTTTATIQIGYSGQVDSFAWILPLTGVPTDVSVGDPAAFTELEQLTSPTFLVASSGGGSFGSGGGYSSGGCGCTEEDAAIAPSAEGGAFPEQANEVTIFGRQTVGPFETVTVGATDAAVLGQWLADNSYDLPEGADALLAAYVEEGSTFLAVKLVPTADTDALEPLQVTYAGDPCLPLRLTSISTADVLPVQIFLAAESRALPRDWPELQIAYETEIVVQGGASNYLEVLDAKMAAAGGHGWVTEYAGQPAERLTPDGPASLLVAGLPWLTRLSARVPRAALDHDPHFRLDSTAPAVDNVHQLPAPAPPTSGSIVGRGLALSPLFGLLFWLASRRRPRR